MLASQIVLAAVIATFAHAQQTTVSGTAYTGCHAHGSTQYCYGPDGEETPIAASTASITPAPISATATDTVQATAVTGCHTHGSGTYCINGEGDEVQISLAFTPTGDVPAQYTDCHSHGSEQYCLDPDGDDVLVLVGTPAVEDNEHPLDSTEPSEGQNCHFHAGVEHCVGPGESESDSESASETCSAQHRDYDIPMRVGTLFAMLATSAFAVFLPMVLDKLPFRTINVTIFTAIKQFGTGVIIATGFVHLYTHAYLMFTNPCIGAIEYEATTSAFVMAGIFVSFLIEYIGHRIVVARSAKDGPEIPSSNPGSDDCSQRSSRSPKEQDAVESPAHASKNVNLAALGHHHGNPFSPTDPNSKLSVLVMEAGILFHSILIGVTLVVSGDSFYRTLLVVIIFHQMFEGLALGARIALIRTERLWPGKILMGLAFALITPLGMAIGIGVLNQFNGRDSTTLWVIGTLDALSAGVLIWVGLIDMWARDWVIDGGDMVHAQAGRLTVGMTSLVLGMVLMSFLGKWA